MKTKLIQTINYLLLIDEEAEIQTGDWCYDYIVNGETGELEPYIFIKRGKVENIETSTINKIIAYYPLVKEAGELDLPLLPNPFEEINIEDLSEKANGYAYYGKPLGEKYLAFKEGFIEGYKAAQSKQFSLEDVEKAIEMVREEHGWSDNSMEYTY